MNFYGIVILSYMCIIVINSYIYTHMYMIMYRFNFQNYQIKCIDRMKHLQNRPNSTPTSFLQQVDVLLEMLKLWNLRFNSYLLDVYILFHCIVFFSPIIISTCKRLSNSIGWIHNSYFYVQTDWEQSIVAKILIYHQNIGNWRERKRPRKLTIKNST